MTSHISFSYFFNYCLYSLIYLISLYAYYFLYLQPIFLFLSLSIMFIPDDQLLFYFETSIEFLTICLDYLWKHIFQLNTNVVYEIYVGLIYDLI